MPVWGLILPCNGTTVAEYGRRHAIAHAAMAVKMKIDESRIWHQWREASKRMARFYRAGSAAVESCSPRADP